MKANKQSVNIHYLTALQIKASFDEYRWRILPHKNSAVRAVL